MILRSHREPLVWVIVLFFVGHLCDTDVAEISSEPEEKRPKKKKKPTLSIETLTLDTYETKVLMVANGTVRKPEYIPIVYFQIPWCQDCKIHYVDFVIAAGNIAQATFEGSLRHIPIPPRFFIFYCEKDDEERKDELRAVCDHHAGRHFPSISVFRDGRVLRFNRQKKSDVITWWTQRVSRLAVTRVDSEDQLKAYSDQEVVFLLAADPGVHDALIGAWHNIALETLDRHVFLITGTNSKLASEMFPYPAVTVKAPAGVTMSPTKLLTVRPNVTEMEAWVNYNQFPVVTTLNPWTLQELKYSQLTVVTLAHGGGAHGAKLKRLWEKKVTKLRAQAKYVWAALNVSWNETHELMANNFPLIPTEAEATDLPVIFVFTGQGGNFRYWEDPSLNSISNLTISSIEALLLGSEAFQEDSTLSWMKEKRKMYFRFSQRSKINMAIGITIPLAFMTCCWYCCKGICNDDGTEPEWLKERRREMEKEREAAEQQKSTTEQSDTAQSDTVESKGAAEKKEE